MTVINLSVREKLSITEVSNLIVREIILEDEGKRMNRPLQTLISQ